jgi:hypothetical protein
VCGSSSLDWLARGLVSYLPARPPGSRGKRSGVRRSAPYSSFRRRWRRSGRLGGFGARRQPRRGWPGQTVARDHRIRSGMVWAQVTPSQPAGVTPTFGRSLVSEASFTQASNGSFRPLFRRFYCRTGITSRGATPRRLDRRRYLPIRAQRARSCPPRQARSTPRPSSRPTDSNTAYPPVEGDSDERRC